MKIFKRYGIIFTKSSDKNCNLVWKREKGYIYGITPLTEITKILNSIDYKKS